VLSMASLDFSLQFLVGGDLRPWLGLVLRGGFGSALRSLSCGLKDATCKSCLLAARCAYGYLFETPVPFDDHSQRIWHPPHPFVWKPPLLDQVAASQSVSLGLTLVGKALDYYPYFILSLEQLACGGLGRDRIRFELTGVRCLKTGADLNKDRGLPESSIFTINPLLDDDNYSGDFSRFKIIMKTPLRLKKSGQRLFHFDFDSFVGSIVRRIELLAEWHCNQDLFLRFSHILESASSVKVISDDSHFHDWFRFNKRQNQVMPVGGTLGEVILEGDYGIFSGLFNAARYLGAGNQTSFGLGQVEFTVLDDEFQCNPGT